MTDPIRVLIVDDHPIVRAGLRATLDAEAGITVAVRWPVARRHSSRPWTRMSC